MPMLHDLMSSPFILIAFLLLVFIISRALRRLEMKNAASGNFDVLLSTRKIELLDYPFKRFLKNGYVNADNIKEVRCNALVPEILVKDGEIIFVPPDKSENLKRFAKENGIDDVNRMDVWGLITAPFLGVKFSDVEKKNMLLQLKKAGFSEKEIKAIRNKIKLKLRLNNFSKKRVDNIGYYEVLQIIYSKTEYEWARNIANRAPIIN